MRRAGLISLISLALFFISNAPSAQASALTRPSNNLGLVGYWSFEDATSTKATDFSGKGNTGTLTPNASGTQTTAGQMWVNGKRGKGLNFDGADDYFSIPWNTDTALNNTTSTIAMWVNIRNTGPNGYAELYAVSGGSGRTGIKFMPGYAIGMDANADFYGVFVPYNLLLNTWYHVVAIIDRNANTFDVYINGTYVGQDTFTGYTPATNNVNIGANNLTGNTGDYLDGKIDEVRIYNRALGATEIAALYNAGTAKEKNVSNIGLTGYWPMNEGSGLTTADYTGQGNTGTLTGTTTPAWTAGRIGKALYFDGSSSKVNLGSVTIGTTATISAWIKTSTSGEVPVLSNRGSGVYFGAATKFFVYDNAATPSPSMYSNAAINDNAWHHIVWTATGATSTMYIDGTLDSQVAQAHPSSAGTAYIGWDASNVGEYFPGYIDEVRVYNRALSAGEVAQLYNQSSTATRVTINTAQNTIAPSNLVFWHTFDGAYLNTTTSTDRSGSGRNGALVGNVHPGIGKIGQAMIFDGTGDYVDAGSSPITGSNPFTLAAWVKTNSFGNYSGAIAIGDTGGGNSAYIGTVAGAQVGSDSSLGGGFYGSNYGSGITNLGQWAHVALTFAGGSGGAAKIYVDGVEKVSTTASPNLGTGTLRIGRITTDTIYDFNGAIDDARVYDRELSAAEILKLYNQGK